MTENASWHGMEPFENPEYLPLNELKLKIRDDGVLQSVNALDKKWVENRYFLYYELPVLYNNDGSEVVGAKENWMEVVGYLIGDIKWLLGLPFYRFWSNVVFNTSILDALVSFLQEAPPFYAIESFPNCPDMLDLLETLRRHVLLVFARLVTNKESPAEYMEPSFLGRLLYEYYIFTIPIIFDLCQLYGRENAKVVEKILDCVFKLEPSYSDDLRKSLPCLIQAFDNIEARICKRVVTGNDEVLLPLKNNEAKELTLVQLEDLILYTLDISSTITVLLKNLPSVTHLFHREEFMNKIVAIYENTIPRIYEKLDSLANNDDDMPKYMELKHRLDVTRVELLTIYRTTIQDPVINTQKNYEALSEEDITKVVDEYTHILSNAISEREFITDYNQFYPVRCDLEILQVLHPQLDAVKCDYILDSMRVVIESCKSNDSGSTVDNQLPIYEAAAGPSRVQEEEPVASCSSILHNGEKNSSENNERDVDLLILKVKDVLPDLGEGFILECLKHYNYNYETVINAVLEDTLPQKLSNLDYTLPIIPPDPMEASAAVDALLGAQRLNVFDNDEFDIMTRDHIDMSRVHLGKKRDKYRDINELLNDKSEVKKAGKIYDKYNLVMDEYSDEYDDTYDSQDIPGTTQDDTTEIDSRPFSTPRVLLGNRKENVVSEEESESEEDTTAQNGKDHFVQNPAELRAKREQRRQDMRGGKHTSSNVIGKPKGQGQDKEALVSRSQKNIHKATRANHNRRSGAQWKRNQGMVPS